jgi:hypothetical protein
MWGLLYSAAGNERLSQVTVGGQHIIAHIGSK